MKNRKNQQTRYYDPSICRFISADQYELLPTLSRSLGELNLYSYCSNNPIMYTDPTGEDFFLVAVLVGLVVGAVAVGTYSGVQAANAGYEGWDLVYEIAKGILMGARLGTVAGMLVGAIGVGFGIIGPQIAAFMGSTLTFGSGAMAVSVSGAQIAAGAAISALGMYTFASTNRPKNNRVQNEQMRAALRKNGLNPNDPKVKDFVNKLEREIRGKHLNYGYQRLSEFIAEKLIKWGIFR